MNNTGEEKMNFEGLGITEEIRRAVSEMGYGEPTVIQAETIPLISSGVDVIGHSQTGSGKTAAFGIPAIQAVNPENRSVQVLVLCPTRELAVQASGEIRKFAKYTHGVKTVPVYGGQPIDRQIKALKLGAHIVIGTPGRIIDHIERRTLKLKNVKIAVLDEADEMLNMGFREDIEKILQNVPEERQTLLFSATMSKDILAITHKYQKNPKIVKIAGKELTVPSIKQFYYDVPRGKKTETLCRLINVSGAKRSMVFCNTKKQVDELASELIAQGFDADALHGDMRQQSRNQVMDRFKGGGCEILVATDVAARGIDVDDIECVYNYDIPQDNEYYVHRIGRTGRAGKEGEAHTFVTGKRQAILLQDIQRFTKSKIRRKNIPTLGDIENKQIETLADKVGGIIAEGGLERELETVDRLMGDGRTASEVAAALIRIIEGTRKKRPGITPEEHTGTPAEEGMSRLRISAGRADKIAAKHIVGAIAGESGIRGGEIGKIEIFDNYTIVDVPACSADKIVNSMKNSKVNGKPVRTEHVR